MRLWILGIVLLLACACTGCTALRHQHLQQGHQSSEKSLSPNADDRDLGWLDFRVEWPSTGGGDVGATGHPAEREITCRWKNRSNRTVLFHLVYDRGCEVPDDIAFRVARETGTPPAASDSDEGWNMNYLWTRSQIKSYPPEALIRLNPGECVTRSFRLISVYRCQPKYVRDFDAAGLYKIHVRYRDVIANDPLTLTVREAPPEAATTKEASEHSN